MSLLKKNLQTSRFLKDLFKPREKLEDRNVFNIGLYSDMSGNIMREMMVSYWLMLVLSKDRNTRVVTVIVVMKLVVTMAPKRYTNRLS